jgi:hypothetical protein
VSNFLGTVSSEGGAWQRVQVQDEVWYVAHRRAVASYAPQPVPVVKELLCLLV